MMEPAIPLNAHTFVSGPAGTGKTSLAVGHLDALLRSAVDGGSILVLAPQRSLLRPYQQLLRRHDLPAGGQVDALTIGGLARRSVDLMWPLIAAGHGFAQPNKPPTFLTLETAQYYMERVVRPLITERFYFDGVRVPGQRLYSQLLDNLNKAALVGFPYSEVGKRLVAAWEGPSAQTITFAQVQDCINRFRDFCKANNLLDFSLQVELLAGLLERTEFRNRLFTRYRHLIVDNVEEDTPFAHELLRKWIPHTESALIVYDANGGYRSFLGADPRSGYMLQSTCDNPIDLSESRVMSIDTAALEAAVTRALSGKADLPTRTPPGSIQAALAFGGGRFHPPMPDWVAAPVRDRVQQHGSSPREIVILAPFLTDSLRFALEDRLSRQAIPTRSLRPSRALNEEAVTRSLMTLAALAHPDWQIAPPQADVAQTLVLSIDALDPARAYLIAERLYRARDGQVELGTFDRLKPELQDRIGYDAGSRVEHLRQWLDDRQHDEAALPLDHFLARLFGEVLSQPGFGFHARIDPGRITAQIIESARKFRQTVNPDPYALNDPGIGRDYVRMVAEGIVAAVYVASPCA